MRKRKLSPGDEIEITKDRPRGAEVSAGETVRVYDTAVGGRVGFVTDEASNRWAVLADDENNLWRRKK